MFNQEFVTKNLNSVYNLFKSESSGEVATYIPELAKVDPDLFSISITDLLGQTLTVGDGACGFTMQSTSKPVLYGLALNQRGSDFVHSKVGVEPTGEAFNSIIELEQKSHRPFNPMINSGAIATTSLILGTDFKSKFNSILNHFESYVGHSLMVDENVYESEQRTAHRNRAIAYLMKHFNVIDTDIEETLNLYFKQCSIIVRTEDLSRIAATFANQGTVPGSKHSVVKPEYSTQILSLMFSCGMYDTAGKWAFRVGLPAKSGVSGAIFASVPGRFGIAAYSPRIDEHGHSVRGRLAIEELGRRLNANIFKVVSENN